ncbi:serine protease filzig isoform X2 [Odontomachus brunneus]|nr:serine protease filzig isoform X2 [Odontomachus brunneus]XP_032687521.1 serine protease filzig isoform X2 [Odontomachus brunneus]XP_032687522.1 serine protease filzig isoform X2 [Odontomachus brunneus]XP_032687523.1 serine protease filzig isoform X2 [Odontomachus brunneus]
MTHLIFVRRLLLALTLIAICATIAESFKNRDRRHVGTEVSSHRSGKVYESDSRSTKSSSSANNEITAEPGRKVSHHLIGGHLRIDTKLRGDESLWDDGILMSAAGNGKEGKNARAGGGGDDEDEKKTLSQQVKEGKYGLIQNEIYGNRPKRPGIISYLGNPEVPKDTADNLGGLDEEEIWLAENHVLVLRGGKFPEHEDGQQGSSGDDASPKWPPIDDYKAPRRQVKIPSRPRIPPPFPVQLTEGGPIQIIGPNGTIDVDNNGTLDYGAEPGYTKGLLPGENPFFTITPNGTIVGPDFGPPQNFSVEEKSSRRGNNEQKRLRPETQPPSGFPPFYHAIPPGAVFVPPPGNQSDYDEEDQSIYYPPPYSFYYQQDNTTAVPPGPLVPGIILPPPPDFFSALDDKKTTTKKYTKRPTTTPSPRPQPTYLPPRKFTTKRYKSSSVLPTSVTKTTVSSTVSEKMSFGRVTAKNATNTYTPKQRITPVVEMTTVTPAKPSTLENTEMYTIGPVNSNQVSEATTQQKDWSTLVTSKTIPVLAYYPSTTQSSLERPVEVTPASIKSIITTGQPGRSSNHHASYYFYAESSDEDSGVTSKPSAVYYKTTTESPYYNVETQSRQTDPKKHYYAVETIAPIETPKDYKAKLIDGVVKNSQTFRYTDSAVTSSKFEPSSPRGQSQRMLADQAPVYYQPASEARPNRPLETYYTTSKPQSYYRPTARPKPIYQYSFQIADYSKRGGNQGLYHRGEQQQQRQQEQNVPYSEYRGIKSGDRQYDYEDIDSPSRQQPPRKDAQYKTQRPIAYPTSTSYSSVVDTTPNPQHAYFTQQDEKLLDDVTKEYFTIFGKKLPDTGISSTTPIYGKSSSITERPEVDAYVSNVYKTGRPVTYKTPNVNVHYGDQSQRPYSLKDDTLVNYRRPLPPINHDSEFIKVLEPKSRPQQAPLPNYELQAENYRLPQNQAGLQQQRRPTPRYRVQGTVQSSSNRHTNNFVPLTESREELEEVHGPPVSLLGDIEVNFRNPRPPINPDAEFVEPVPEQDNRSDNPNAYFAYRLPGDVGHFYFLTPQAITQRQDQDGGYIYPKPREPRLLRRRRRPGDA